MLIIPARSPRGTKKTRQKARRGEPRPAHRGTAGSVLGLTAFRESLVPGSGQRVGEPPPRPWNTTAAVLEAAGLVEVRSQRSADRRIHGLRTVRPARPRLWTKYADTTVVKARRHGPNLRLCLGPPPMQLPFHRARNPTAPRAEPPHRRTWVAWSACAGVRL